MPNKIAAVTTGRQDYGILRSTLLLLQAHPEFELQVWAGGMHLAPQFGRTIDAIRSDGFEPALLDFLHEPPTPALDSAAAIIAATAAIERARPDALLLVGDRYETLAVAVAATLARVPIAHLHGGEETEGAIDNACRHAITKLSHLHLVSHPAHARRVIQMGEDPDAVVVVGAPGLDNRFRADLLSRAALEDALGFALVPPVFIVTLHPTTLSEAGNAEVAELAGALDSFNGTFVITQPNTDSGGAEIGRYWLEWSKSRSHVHLLQALGEQKYWALMREGDVMVGNSSSGIIEAPFAGLPVVNIGDRQKGRLRVGQVLDCPPEREAIRLAIQNALKAGRLDSAPDGFLSGPAAPRIIKALESWKLESPPRKRFVDLPWQLASQAGVS